MQVAELAVPGAWVFTPVQHPDERGVNLEWLRADRLAEVTGRVLDLAQANLSVSRRGVVRGVHVCAVPPGQAKYVTCTAGAVLDVVVDLRVGSPTFGRHAAVHLDDHERRAVFLAEGLGHAFLGLAEQSTVVYLLSSGYDPAREFAVNPLDPELALPWPRDVRPVLSERDAGAPGLAAVADRLPRWADCAPR